MVKRVFFLLFHICLVMPLFSQEYINSWKERRLDYEALTGNTERPYLNYRTLSDSLWSGLAENKEKTLRIYGPALFTSFNSTAPYGMNDGLLWQGRGINNIFSGGFRAALGPFSLSVLPELTFSQNLAFDYVDPAYSGPEYEDKAALYGYYGVKYIDAPQRFGNESYFDFGWGNSEIRINWKKATLGFGTQQVWLGPGRISAILHSTNAAPYPRLDAGLRRTPVYIYGRYIGDLEARIFSGVIQESDYFDNKSDNDYNFNNMLSVAYAPSPLPGLVLFANRSYLAPFGWEGLGSLGSLLFINLEGGGGQDEWDQRASFGFSWLLPSAGVEFYGEAGINDYSPSLDGYIRYPFHSMVYTGGFRKSVSLPGLREGGAELLFEWSNLELSQDFQFQWPGTFYAHHQIQQGYTNGGQWLGAGIGSGGNSQYLGFTLYQRLWSATLFIHRINPDNDYNYSKTIQEETDPEGIWDFRADLSFGAEAELRLCTGFSYEFSLVYTMIHNPLYETISLDKTDKEHNLHASVLVKYKLGQDSGHE